MADIEKKSGYVALVGAGPGDPGLITVRGMKLITDCDVLVYDNLMADEYIAVSNATEKIFVGKSSGRHALPQEQINELLVEKAKEGKFVVRLKGGDSFVFGRGGEEINSLTKADIAYEIVPGITAGIAGPAYAGIPVTHRELSRGVTMMTAHFAKNKNVELPWKALANLGHTLVFYMGIASLEKLGTSLINAGMSPDISAAVLERATTGSQRNVIATLGTIAEKCRESGVKPPGLIVIGDVVNLEKTLKWLPERPLEGKGIMFTRAAKSQYKAVHMLRRLGAEVLDVPVVKTVARKNDEAIESALENLEQYKSIAFTSALGVDIFFEAMHEKGMDVRSLSKHILAAASKTVIGALKDKGVIADVTPEKTGGGNLAKILSASGLEQGAKILLPRSSAADNALPESMIKAGFDPHSLSVYDSVPTDLSWLKVKLNNWTPDAVAFLSGTGVNAIKQAAPQLFEGDNQPLWACVGHKTAESLKQYGIEADILPQIPDVDALAEVVKAKLA